MTDIAQDADGTQPPDFITRQDITEMSDDEIDALLVPIRERRLKMAVLHRQALELKEEKARGKAREKLGDQIRMLEKELASMDKLIEKLDKRVLNIRALRLEIEG